MASESDQRNDDIISDYRDVQRFLTDSVIVANAQITVLKRLLIDNKVILDPDAFESACRQEQISEIKKLAAKSDYARKWAESAEKRLGLTPQGD